MENERVAIEGWAIVDLMGHLRMGGYVTDVEFGGTRVGRIDVPAEGDEPASTHLFGGQSIYRLTFVAEDLARRAARSSPARPIDHYEISSEIRASLEATERERIEQRVKVDAKREYQIAAGEERRRVLDILSDARSVAQAIVGSVSETSRAKVSDLQVAAANRLMGDITTYCDESHQRLRGESRVTTYMDDDGDDELKEMPF